MRHWDTGDAATDANLRFLESLGSMWEGMDVEQFMDKLRNTISVREMLPTAILRHFHFPPLFIGAQAYHWTPDRLRTEARKLCDSINAGLDSVAADVSLKPGGGADLGDRAQSKGERVLLALQAYNERRGTSELSALRIAIQGTSLHPQFAKLEGALQRKRASGSLSPAQEVLRAIGELEWYASSYHHEKA